MALNVSYYVFENAIKEINLSFCSDKFIKQLDVLKGIIEEESQNEVPLPEYDALPDDLKDTLERFLIGVIVSYHTDELRVREPYFFQKRYKGFILKQRFDDAKWNVWNDGDLDYDTEFKRTPKGDVRTTKDCLNCPHYSLAKDSFYYCKAKVCPSLDFFYCMENRAFFLINFYVELNLQRFIKIMPDYLYQYSLEFITKTKNLSLAITNNAYKILSTEIVLQFVRNFPRIMRYKEKWKDLIENLIEEKLYLYE